MQIYAKDTQNRIITADKALKSEIYFCLECNLRVGIRKSFLKRTHFFHFHYNRICKSSGKSLTHLQVQNTIKERIGGNEIVIEKYFPEIKRIADVCWENKKIIFEVQCSYITPEEIASRNHDYQQIGYQVVWILHDKKYNQNQITEAEKFLFNHTHYFTNINIDKKGLIYDKLNRNKYPIQIHKPLISHTCSNPEFIKQRELNWKIHFEDDLMDLFYKNNLNDENLRLLLKWNLKKNEDSFFRKLLNKFKKRYLSLLHYFLESACK